MKTNSTLKDGLMITGKSFKMVFSLVLISIFLLAIVPMHSYGQAKPDKKEADIKRLEAALKTTQTNLAKAQRQVTIADSLLETGD